MVTNLLEYGSRWLDDRRVRHLSRPVVYTRGDAAVSVQAAIGRTTFEVDNGTGVFESYESRDFLISSADLVLDETLVLPQRGDRIQEEQNGVTYVYEVMAPGREPVFRFSDTYRQTLRIHTKLVEAT